MRLLEGTGGEVGEINSLNTFYEVVEKEHRKEGEGGPKTQDCLHLLPRKGAEHFIPPSPTCVGSPGTPRIQATG